MFTQKPKGGFLTLLLTTALGVGLLYVESGGELRVLRQLAHFDRSPAGYSTSGGPLTPLSVEPIVSSRPSGPSESASSRDRAQRWEKLEAAPGRKAPAFLVRYEALDKKALKSNAELRELQKLMADPGSVRAAASYLSSVEPDISLHQTLKRIEIVDFLIEAERWPTNPNRPAVVRAMQEFILQKGNLAEVSDRSRKAMAGDKIELYNALRAADPQIAAAIRQAATGSELEKLLEFAEAGPRENGLRAPSTPPSAPDRAS